MSTSTSSEHPMGNALIQPGETKQMAIERLEGELSELSDRASRLEDVALIAAGKADFAARKSRETASRGMRGDLDTSRLLQDAANAKGQSSLTNHELKIKQQQLDSLLYPNGKPTPEPEFPTPIHPILGAFGWLAKTSYDYAAYYLTPTAKTDTSSTSTAQRV